MYLTARRQGAMLISYKAGLGVEESAV